MATEKSDGYSFLKMKEHQTSTLQSDSLLVGGMPHNRIAQACTSCKPPSIYYQVQLCEHSPVFVHIPYQTNQITKEDEQQHINQNRSPSV
jgi:hypothetical protein